MLWHAVCPNLVETFISIIRSGLHMEVGHEDSGLSDEVMLSIGKHVESLVEAADRGDGKTFASLAERLRDTAEQYQVAPIVEAATDAIKATNEDAALEQLVNGAFGLLAACRDLHNSPDSEPSDREITTQLEN